MVQEGIVLGHSISK